MGPTLRLAVLHCALIAGVGAAEPRAPDCRYVPIDPTAANTEFSSRVTIVAGPPIASLQLLTPSPHGVYKLASGPVGGPIASPTVLQVVNAATDHRVTITIADHVVDGVRAAWIDDKYLRVTAWLGHIACLAFIYDADGDRVVTADMEMHDGYLMRQQADAAGSSGAVNP